MPGFLEKDLKGRRLGTASPYELGREVQVDVRRLGQLASRLASVTRSLELLLTPEEDALGFGVEFEDLEFSRSHCS